MYKLGPLLINVTK
ncbi:hypothetical protein MIMGU_mgv1a0264732mg, partial [Erythranthe guttata]